MTGPPSPDLRNSAQRAHQAQEAFTAAAQLLATQPEAVQRALIEHRRTADGRCHRCGPTTRWPCAIATIARQAVTLAPP